MNALATLILRFKRPQAREWKVPLNFRFRGIEVPVGLALVTLILFATAIANLLTKKIATISGLIFTAGLVCRAADLRAHNDRQEAQRIQRS